MKRSQINKALKELETMCKKHCCYLPPFCHFTPEEWKHLGHEYDEIRDCMLGWDIRWYKTEDIINRGGGNVLIRVYNSLPDESIDYVSDVTVHTDGRTYTVPAGTQIRLTPGESIYIQQYLYQDFTVEAGSGDVLLGEVSQRNDDNTDNRFEPPVGRFPEIKEDEASYRLLCNEYPAAK